MKRVMLLALIAALVLPFSARAQGKADFSGTWTLDTAKSDPPPQGRGGGGGGGGGGTQTIKQTASELSVTSEGRGRGSEFVVLLPNVREHRDAVNVAEKLLQRIEHPVVIALHSQRDIG